MRITLNTDPADDELWNGLVTKGPRGSAQLTLYLTRLVREDLARREAAPSVNIAQNPQLARLLGLKLDTLANASRYLENLVAGQVRGLLDQIEQLREGVALIGEDLTPP